MYCIRTTRFPRIGVKPVIYCTVLMLHLLQKPVVLAKSRGASGLRARTRTGGWRPLQRAPPRRRVRGGRAAGACFVDLALLQPAWPMRTAGDDSGQREVEFENVCKLMVNVLKHL